MGWALHKSGATAVGDFNLLMMVTSGDLRPPLAKTTVALTTKQR